MMWIPRPHSGSDPKDPRERDCLKAFLHEFVAILHVFFKMNYECDTCNGVGKLFEILGSFINGLILH